MHFRPATPDDLPALAELYADTVERMAPAMYEPEQVRVWANSAREANRFRDFVLKPRTIVALWEGVLHPVGFAGLETSGRIASLYVHADYGRRGIASALLGNLLEQAQSEGLARVRTEASKFSRPVFERFGFGLDEIERGVHHGVPFMRFLMSREMQPSAGGQAQQ